MARTHDGQDGSPKQDYSTRGAFSSLATRFAATALVGAGIGFASVAALVVHRQEAGLTIQASELGALSDTKLAERLDSDARLARARLDRLTNDVALSVAGIGQRVDVQRALLSQSKELVAAVLRKAARTNALDGIVVVDARMRIIGAQSGTINFAAVNAALRQSEFSASIRGLLNVNDPAAPTSLQRVVNFNASIARALGADQLAPLGIVAVDPMFDEAGEISGAIIAHRLIRPTEPAFAEFASLTGTAIAVIAQGELATQGGLSPGFQTDFHQLDARFLTSDTQKLVARCIDFETSAKICAALPIGELYALRTEMTRSGYAQGRVLVLWLMGLSGFFLFLFGAMSLFMARAVTRPLERITQSVKAVARGDWRSPVTSRTRKDEVGDIARAVVALQGSMQERDNLRADIVIQNADLIAKEDLLRKQNLLFNAALTNMSQGLCMLDADLRVIVFNERYEDMLQLGKGTVESGLTLEEIARQVPDTDVKACFLRVIDAHGRLLADDSSHSLNVNMSDGRTISISQRPTSNGGFVATLADISERKRNEERIDYLAHHDSLTGLPNRVTWHQQLTQSFDALQLGENLAVLCLDLDRFKIVNDTLGHAIGDAVLKVVGARLTNLVRAGDTVARIGGDEFAILQRNPKSRQDVAELARRIIAGMKAPITIEGRKLDIGVSIGIALAPDDGVDFDRLFKMADLALYRVKHTDANDYCFFDPEMDAREETRRALELDLRDALEKNQFHLLYQPIVDARSTQPVGFEALLRWQHPVRGLVSPAEFIPLAEELGLIVPIGAWVVRTACATAATWPDHITIAVNISPLQITDGGLGLTVVSALGATGLSPRRLELEITEAVLLESSRATLATLHELRALGIRFSMDDYGTGYSSLRSLRSFPFDKIKIDQSFVRELTGADQNSLIVQSICGLAKGLGMTTVAEGVETAEQLQLLRAAGCNALQGYMFGRPMSAENAARAIPKVRARKMNAVA